MNKDGSISYKLIGAIGETVHKELWANDDAHAVAKARKLFNLERIVPFKTRDTELGQVVAVMRHNQDGRDYRLVRLPEN